MYRSSHSWRHRLYQISTLTPTKVIDLAGVKNALRIPSFSKMCIPHPVLYLHISSSGLATCSSSQSTISGSCSLVLLTRIGSAKEVRSFPSLDICREGFLHIDAWNSVLENGPDCLGFFYPFLVELYYWSLLKGVSGGALWGSSKWLLGSLCSRLTGRCPFFLWDDKC